MEDSLRVFDDMQSIAAAEDCIASSTDFTSQRERLPNQCADCFLQQHCMARELDVEARMAMAEVTDHPKPLQRGKFLYRQADSFDRIYIVRSGAIKTSYLDEEGEENITGFYLPGEMFGVDGVTEGRYRFSAQALDTTAVCAIDFSRFEALFGDYPAVQRQFTNVLCDEIYHRQQPLLRLRQFTAEARLSAFLLDLASRLNQRNRSVESFSLPMARRDIARYLCLAEETLSRLFRSFQERELLKIRGRRVESFNAQAFQGLSSTAAPSRSGIH